MGRVLGRGDDASLEHHQQRNKPVECASLEHHVRMAESGSLTEDFLLEKLERTRDLSLLNVGAADGQADDPLSALSHRAGSNVIAVERNPELCEQYRRNFPRAVLICDALTPENSREKIFAAAAGWEQGGGRRRLPLSVLKIDIDSFDCSLAEMLIDML